MGMMFFLEINAMILSPLFVEAWPLLISGGPY
jgi:hypothetical protein